MGLDMKTRKTLTEETAKRYCTEGKKEKTKIIDEFTATTGYNRKYAIHVLKNSARIKTTHFNNKERKSVQTTIKARKKRPFKKYYGENVKAEVVHLWIYSMYQCSKRLATFIRDNLDYLAEKFSYAEELKAKLKTISSATIGRMIRPEIPRHSIRGISTTRPAKNLNKLIPIRVYFDWDERKPGFFEIDTVANCGMSTAGEYISTLTLTDVCSGWTENRALLNKAQRWVKEAVDDVKNKIPFPMKGIDSDNGSEFKNMQLLSWCRENSVNFTRSRPYRKNDNCFVEQKNDSVVRRIVGYYRFEGEEEILHPDFWNLLEKLHSLEIPFTIMGNPFHLTAENCVRMKNLGCKKYQMSLDRLEKTHDWFRKPGSFRTTLSKIPLINDAGMHSVIMSTVSSKNIAEIPDLIDICTENNVDIFAFSRYCPSQGDTTNGITSFCSSATKSLNITTIFILQEKGGSGATRRTTCGRSSTTKKAASRFLKTLKKI